MSATPLPPPALPGAFSVTVQARHALGAGAAVDTDTPVSLSPKTGTGVLGGVAAGTILAGAQTAVITGVTYSVVEGGVSLTATGTGGDSLAAGEAARSRPCRRLSGSPSRW